MIRIEIETDNAAFADGNKDAEIARILRRLAREIEADPRTLAGSGERLRDVNGNTVGLAVETEE